LEPSSTRNKDITSPSLIVTAFEKVPGAAQEETAPGSRLPQPANCVRLSRAPLSTLDAPAGVLLYQPPCANERL